MRIPVLRLGRLLLTSLQVDLTDDHAIGLQTDILTLLQGDKADGLVLDVTGLDVVDSYMARILNDTARMARVMGAEVVMTGMQPMVALTLVEMGREIIGIEAALDLDAGVTLLRNLIATRRARQAEADPIGSRSGSPHAE